MKYFQKKSIKLLCLSTVLTFATFFACKRTSDFQVTKDTFGVDQAKEWYYGYFKKSIYFKKLNVNSPFVGDFDKTVSSRTGNTEAGNLKKSPKWGLAQSVTKNGLQIVEMPILYDITTILLPGTQSKSQSVKEQLANASLNKILFIKKPNGQISIRLVTIVPSADYAASKNYDISNNNATNLEDNFSGYIMVRKWDETPIKTLKILNGNSYKNVTMRKMVNNVQTETEQTPCYFEWVPKIYRTCAIAYQGDEPDHECEEWDEVESPTEGSWELNEDCGSGGEQDDEDLCLLFNIGCEVDEEDPCAMYGNCEDEEENECLQYKDDALSIMNDALSSAQISNEISIGESTYSTEIDDIGEIIQTKQSTATSEYLRINNPIIGQAIYTAYYTVFLSRRNNNSEWLFSQPANLVTHKMSSGSVRACFSIEHTMSETAKNIRGDKKEVTSDITFSTSLNFTCAPFSTITSNPETHSLTIPFLSNQFQN
jgi:hypothetical protein